MITVYEKSNHWMMIEEGGRRGRRESEQLTDARNCTLTVNRVIFEVHIREK
jgi:hypothetical protein